MTSQEWDRVLFEADLAVRELRYEDALSLADRWIAANDEADSRALWLRARALTGLGRAGQAASAWERVIALPARSEVERVAQAEAHQHLAQIQIAEEHSMAHAVVASDVVTAALGDVGSRDLLLRLGQRGAWLLKLLVGQFYYTEADALSRAVIDAQLAGEGEEGISVDLTARLMGMVASVNLGEPDRVEQLVESIAEAGEPGLRVLDEWLDTLERIGGEERQGFIVTALALKAANLASSQHPTEAREMLLATRARFASSQNPQVQAALAGTEPLLGLLDQPN